jgi:hypothetical protein
VKLNRKHGSKARSNQESKIWKSTTIHIPNPPRRDKKKKIHALLWEFLMLFLAVFCGFLAENFREHQVEHQRERQYMITMLEDLESDTSLLAECVAFWDNINNSIDSVTSSIQFPLSKTDFAKAYRHLSIALNYYGFNYNERTIAQLKNSGGFRLIRQREVANKITLYDQLNLNALKKIDAQHNLLYMQTLLCAIGICTGNNQ